MRKFDHSLFGNCRVERDNVVRFEEPGDHNRRHIWIIGDAVRMKSDKAIGPAKVHFSISGPVARLRIPRLDGDSVIPIVVFEYGRAGIEFRNAPTRTDPKEATVVFED